MSDEHLSGEQAPNDGATQDAKPFAGKSLLIIIGGGIAAYKVLELIRRAKDRGFAVRAILTKAATEFVTPLSVASLSGEKAYTDLFSLTDEADIGHIALSRSSDLIVVAPATADLLAKAANGFGDDLASTALLATDTPILVAPAMNPRMWAHPATVRNVETLRGDGVHFVGPNSGAMAERGESGLGRMAEPMEILAAVESLLSPARLLLSPADDAARKLALLPLAGKRVLVTSGPTHEPIDPVRYIANRSSGKQGHAIAAAAAEAGAEVILVSGPVNLPDPPGVRVRRVSTAREMLAAVLENLPVDLAIFAAAVADWRAAEEADAKIKKGKGPVPQLSLVENPDILATVAKGSPRPRLVVGFAAETDTVLEHARAKLARKGCDWIVANDVGKGTGVMGGGSNTVHLISEEGIESWPTMDKSEVARRLVARAAERLREDTP
ncbi:bifunctional phosphopantothenoylcysteine decarboxylase/phosphopantothenate--cysteine ligase CoaBC [Pseudochelatococcus contaminans]|uniref:Coenzyme A biosynthesis bifunctional protein CoaBC n=1 Tax=Pseudochelatococcus contaminans TaxID=1538103 RepID=A0A7W6EHZ7_9HYPH|nr:bifunctional phosphopantothenoylcysteine decarboxylase/phosphopantothenate--cysteine ligase CoaBC [Pseudochelatococcus contaminans]MBB3810187.1 phosphopantothenoylcysteine decarboxylase/phosphopantothenate--cysteine ligase [Pseudochelatococcus contaminans]